MGSNKKVAPKRPEINADIYGQIEVHADGLGLYANQLINIILKSWLREPVVLLDNRPATQPKPTKKNATTDAANSSSGTKDQAIPPPPILPVDSNPWVSMRPIHYPHENALLSFMMYHSKHNPDKVPPLPRAGFTDVNRNDEDWQLARDYVKAVIDFAPETIDDADATKRVLNRF